MKKISSILAASALIFTTFSCEDTEKDRLEKDSITTGAILRTLETVNPPINRGNPGSSNLSAKIQYDDFANDDTMESVDYYLEFVDTSPVGGVVMEIPEVLLGNIPASAFTAGEGGPETTIDVNIAEGLTALGISADDLYGGDIFLLRLALKTTDGGVFTSDNVGVKIQTSSAFSSPFRYSAPVACPPPASLSGDWVIDMQDSYGDGWNGASITVVSGGVATDYTITGSEGTHTVNAPLGELFTFTFNGGDWDEEVTYQIKDPSGAVVADHGPTPATGAVKLTVDFCAE